MISNQRAWLTLSMSALTFFFMTAQISQAATITQLATSVDKTDFQALGIGKAGYWFPQFDAGSPVEKRPTDESMQFFPPSWAGFQFDSTQPDRTFSLDAGCFSGNIEPFCINVPTDPLVFGVYSKGGDTDWDTFTLPDGTTGLSGAVVDEHAANNSNNSFNRISLNAGTPASFVLHIVVDNTDGDHNPAGRLRVRGANGDSGSPDLDSVQLNSGDMTYNGTTDVYSFRFDDFVATDFIKIQLNSGAVGKYPSVAGIMFDVVPIPVTIDIKPGNKRNKINPRSRGGIWVAILSDTETPFDALQIDIPTVRFGPGGAKANRHKVKDVNKDGLPDLMLRFKIRKTGIVCGDTEEILVGETFGGIQFTGTDAVKTVGCK